MGNNEYKTIEFDTSGKTFCLRLSKDSCYKCNSGKCSLDDISLDELKTYKTDGTQNGENEINYCRKIARTILRDEFIEKTIIYSNYCNHYTITDGQHRSCSISKLKKKGANIKQVVMFGNNDKLCYYCGRNKKRIEEIKIFKEQNLIYRIRNRKRLKELLAEGKVLNDYFQIWDF